MKTPYDNVDKRIAKLKEDNRKLLNNLRLRLSTFDEANIISAKKQINVIFEKMKQNALSVYLKSVKEIYPDIDKKMLLDWLDTVYIVTQYNFFNEWERKEARYFEMITAFRQSGESLNSADMLQAQKRAVNSLNNQIEEFGIMTVDNAIIQNAEDESEEEFPKMKWHTEEDNKVCHICRERDGKIYRTDKIPVKHLNCRRWLELEKE